MFESLKCNSCLAAQTGVVAVARRWTGIAAAVLGLFIAPGMVSAQHHVVQLRALSHVAGQAGTTLEMHAALGTHLDEVDSLYFSHPRIKAELKTLDPLPFQQQRRPHYGRFSVTIPSDVPAGRYEVRTGGRHGVSNPRAFVVTSLPVETPDRISHDPDAATELAIGTIAQGKAVPAEVDYFRVKLDVVRSLRIELLAQRIDSAMIGQIELYDAAGRQLAATRGADDFDPVMQVESLQPGQYLLAVQDFTYRGGDEYKYLVVVEDGAEARPLIGANGGAPGQLPGVWLTRSFTVPGGEPLAASDESPESARVDVPTEQTWWFPGDRNDSVFEFTAQQGQTYAVDVVSQRVGQPTDPRMLVQRIEPQQSGPPKLHDVLNTDDSQNLGDGALNLFSKDPVALFRSPATADYRIMVRDLDTGVSLLPRQQYKLRIRVPNPGFDLLAYRLFPHRDVNQTAPQGAKLFRGGAEVIRILAIRRDGWTGPIQIVMEDPPPGVTANPAVIAANQSQTQLILMADEDAAAVTSPLELLGRSEDGSILQRVVPATVTWAKGGGRDYIRSRISSSLYVAVSDRDTAAISITLGDGSIPEVKKGGSISLPIKIVRREGGKAQCVLRARDLPPGTTLADVTIPADKNEAACELKVTPKAAAGTYSLWLQVETKIKLRPNPQALERAQQYRSHLQALHDDPAHAANLESIKSAIAEADKQIDAAKAAANEQELTVFLPTSGATIRIVDP